MRVDLLRGFDQMRLIVIQASHMTKIVISTSMTPSLSYGDLSKRLFSRWSRFSFRTCNTPPRKKADKTQGTRQHAKNSNMTPSPFYFNTNQ